MQVLLVAATPFEIGPLTHTLEQEFQPLENGTLFERNGLWVRPAITGIGVMATAWHLALALERYRPDLVVNAGVAGAFDRSLPLGMVVQVRTERLGDLGVEEADGRFTDLFDLGLAEPDQPPFIQGILHNPEADTHNFLPAVNGLTVNRVHGQEASIAAIQQKYPQVQVETMEGAAFFYACLQAGVPFLAIRSLSNYVEPRNRDAWELGLAIESLNAVILEMLLSLVPEAE
ncbi:MAG: futalosine hydrolase [Bacteroidetes bacterium]|nr:MAG: futalosine hydrolase [Bacteroidota bacterium]